MYSILYLQHNFVAMRNSTDNLLNDLKEAQSFQDSYAPGIFGGSPADVGEEHSNDRLCQDGEGREWAAYLFFFCSGPVCKFYKKCLTRECRSEEEARMVVEYGKQFSVINQDVNGPVIESTALNLN